MLKQISNKNTLKRMFMQEVVGHSLSKNSKEYFMLFYSVFRLPSSDYLLIRNTLLLPKEKLLLDSIRKLFSKDKSKPKVYYKYSVYNIKRELKRDMVSEEKEYSWHKVLPTSVISNNLDAMRQRRSFELNQGVDRD